MPTERIWEKQADERIAEDGGDLADGLIQRGIAIAHERSPSKTTHDDLRCAIETPSGGWDRRGDVPCPLTMYAARFRNVRHVPNIRPPREVIKSALAVYHWFVRQALTGSRVVARKPTGEEVAIETAELALLEGKGNRLSPEELGLLAKRLAAASNPVEAARIRERLTRGFYGI